MFTKKDIFPYLEGGQESQACSSSAAELCELFERNGCVQWILKHNFKKVCVQLPDDFLCYAVAISSYLESQLGSMVYVLGDGIYGSCCVDEITAQHIGADAVIHFGHYCLSPSVRLPVLHIFEKKSIDITSFVRSLREFFPNSTERIGLIYDVAYEHAIGSIMEQISEDYPKLVVSKLLTDELENSENYSVLGRTFKLEHGVDIEEYCMVFIGPEEHCLENIRHTLIGCHFYIFDPDVHKSVQIINEPSIGPFYRKRMYLIEKVKHAQTFGILIGTLSVANYDAAVDRIKTMVKNRGKKCYIFAVGKPTVEKLANFPEVDVYVLVACPESTIIGTKKFYQPIVTLYEVELALNPGHVCSLKHVTDFRTLLPGGCNYVPDKDLPDDASDVSLIDGRAIFVGRSGHESDESQETSAISLRWDSTVSNQLSSQSFSLSSRSWTGLQQNLGMTELALAVPGRQGIPLKYTNEEHNEL